MFRYLPGLLRIGADIPRKLMFKGIVPEVGGIGLARIFVPFGGKDTFAADFLKRSAQTADACEQIQSILWGEAFELLERRPEALLLDIREEEEGPNLHARSRRLPMSRLLQDASELAADAPLSPPDETALSWRVFTVLISTCVALCVRR